MSSGLSGELAQSYEGRPGQYQGVVTQLGTTYRGELSFIVGRAPVEGV
jgi:hypothetical protein